MALAVTTYVLVAGCVLRIALIAGRSPHFVDFYCFVDAAQALMRGVDPFDLSNLRWARWQEAPLVYPGLALFFIPFALLGPEIGKHVFFAANVTAGVAYYAMVVRASGLCTRYSLRSPDVQTMIVTLGAFLFVNSMFFALCVRVGQISIFAALLVFAAFCARTERKATFAFAGAAIAKYSNVPLVGVYFALTGRARMCVYSLLVFVAVSLVPSVFGHDPVHLYGAYLKSLASWMAPGGGNDFAVSGQTMVSAGFFADARLRGSLQMLLLIAFGVVVWKERAKRGQRRGLVVLFALICVTLSITYHRGYDAVLAYPLLLVLCAQSWRDGKWAHFCVSGFFALAFAMPGAMLEGAGRAIGRTAEMDPIILIPDGQFPLMSVLFFLQTAYAVVLWSGLGARAGLGETSAGH